MPISSLAVNGHELGDTYPLPVGLGADARTGALFSLSVTLSGTPNTVTTITLPDNARGFRLYPTSNDVRFAVGENPATLATATATTIAAAAFGVGGIAKGDQFETRLLEAGTSRTLRLSSATASTVVTAETF